MAQGEFTKDEAKQTQKAVEELFGAIPKSKRPGYLGHLNDISLFLTAAEDSAPDSQEHSAGCDNEEDYDDPRYVDPGRNSG